MELNLWITIFHLKAFARNAGEEKVTAKESKCTRGSFILTAKEAEKDNGCIINTAKTNQLCCVNNKSKLYADRFKEQENLQVLSQKA